MERPSNIFIKLGDVFDWLGKKLHHYGFRNNRYWFVSAGGLSKEDKIHE